MMSLRTFIPDSATLIKMHRADLAGYILETLISTEQTGKSFLWNRRSFCQEVVHEYAESGQGFDKNIGIACSTAWAWLEANGFICLNPSQDNEWFVATPLGVSVRNHQALRQLISNEQLPEDFLHSELLIRVRQFFLQSHFDLAVFEAFRLLEIRIREKAGLGDEMIGTKLANCAFHPENGALIDKTAENGERVALMNLMVGAIGSYKNPTSHRRVQITAEEARDMIILASHLLKIVDARSIAC